MEDYPQKQGLYDPSYEHDACGIGAIAQINGIKTHKTIKDALDILIHLEHRGGTGAEDNSGDGAGILFQIPHKFFNSEILGFELPNEFDYGVGQLFLSKNEIQREKEIELINNGLKSEGLEILGYRRVPVDTTDIGLTAFKAMPYIAQVFVKRPDKVQRGIAFERKLYVARRVIESLAIKENSRLYFCSFSSRTIVYKGMLVSTQVRNFFLDLLDTKVESAIALVHSRFSTNTFPSWDRAHPNRFLCHNGEINTIRGNVNMVKAREGLFKSDVFNGDLKKIMPIIPKESSDSAMFDNFLEFMYLNGRSLEETIMMMIPEPWDHDKDMDPSLKSFYEFHSTFQEPWDGPASLIFSDGIKVGASLDRNGLRPSRYYITKDNYLVLFSETGSLDIDEKNIKEKRRLEPGKILLVDTSKGMVISNDDIKKEYANKNPYIEWNKKIIKLNDLPKEKKIKREYDINLKEQQVGYTYDELMDSIIPLAEKGAEKVVSMGNDIPLAVLMNKEFNLFQFFKQRFAQVTNPPIDSIREEIVMATFNYLGSEGNLLSPTEANAFRVRIDNPILSDEEFYKIRNLYSKGIKTEIVSICYDYERETMEEALERIFNECDIKIDSGASIIILSDRNQNGIAIPSLLVASGVHQHLTKALRRTHVSIVLEAAEPRDIHHYACLIGFGVNAIYPYLVYETIEYYKDRGYIKLPLEDAISNYINGVMHSITKIMAKMGISTIQSYNGAQIFECLGLNDDIVSKYFTNTPSSIGGIGIKEIEENTIKVYKNALNHKDQTLDSLGLHGYRKKQIDHIYDPLTIMHLQSACRSGNYDEYKEFTSLIDKKVINIRNTFKLNYKNSISIDEVESVDEIVKRFKTGAMSYGSISKEAHECMALAMNRLHAKSNTGEGGEERERYEKLANGDSKCSAIKQVASGRFGVTIEYLTNAIEIQIKMAQGAKPGEGGQLPGQKVFPWIAKARHSTPGVSLISPPPHHDIYSIEDLAQLIFDLKNANREARISVKLVSESGVGTIAAGVVKAGANTILISGYDGGTGAAPRTSIYNAGIPWEIGLSEAHQTLVMNGLRDRVRLETDGKLLTGKDLAIAILLGAEEFGFATGPLIAMGCIMMRVCNLNTCPVGVATQDENLRKRFSGKPEYVMNFMRFIAKELREYMALLGFKTIDSMVGHTELLSIDSKYKDKINLSKLLFNEEVVNKESVFKAYKPIDLKNTVDYRMLLPLCKSAIDGGLSKRVDLEISNINRAFGTMLSNEITKKYGEVGLKEDSIIINAHGHAGNSFGCLLTKGVSITVYGDANDYFGKSLCGGKLTVIPQKAATFKPEENIICGNVALYGATSGKCFLEGVAGERFAVRNSGALVVSLGCGQHGCEYMTGGTALVLGKIGRNFAAGMSGGVAYIYGLDNKKNVNKELVSILDLNENDEALVKDIIKEHISHTNSKYAKNILDSFNKKDFFKVLPNDYAKIIELISYYKNTGSESPELDAFNKFMEGK
ncbi:MAG: glutamate synthase large subunit [Acholeplasmatales bacterium]|nr:glutamate synthase large subunit [Acholeplasmatales bacterium]